MNVKMKSYTVKSVMYLFLVIMAVIALFPVVYTFFGALKDNMELLTSGRILPKKIIFDNYIYAFEKVNFGRYTLNSIFVTFVTVVLSLIIATMGGYAIERKDFPGKKIIEVIFNNDIEEFAETIENLQKGTLKPDALISDILTGDKAQEAFEMLEAEPEKHLKILLKF